MAEEGVGHCPPYRQDSYQRKRGRPGGRLPVAPGQCTERGEELEGEMEEDADAEGHRGAFVQDRGSGPETREKRREIFRQVRGEAQVLSAHRMDEAERRRVERLAREGGHDRRGVRSERSGRGLAA